METLKNAPKQAKNEFLHTQIVELRKLISDIESEDLHNFDANIVLPILKSKLSELQDEYFENGLTAKGFER